MASGMRVCAHCGGPVPPEATVCPTCEVPVRPLTAPGAPTPAGGAPPAAAARGTAEREELERRLTKLRQWTQAAGPLGLEVPEMPAWAIAFTQTDEPLEGWVEVMRGIERLAQQRVVQSLESWARLAEGRLRRLEAYSVDSRLEREEIEDALHTAKSGDVARALSTYQQVDRVVTLKEKHLDSAREELERLVTLFRDMAALGIRPPDDPEELSRDLERELRRGRLAPLKQRLREFHGQAVTELKRSLPALVSRWGDQLVRNRSDGKKIDPEAAALARAARAYAYGRLEESVRELRKLESVGAPAGVPDAARAAKPGGATRD